jgi:Animal haem peroxidase
MRPSNQDGLSAPKSGQNSFSIANLQGGHGHHHHHQPAPDAPDAIEFRTIDGTQNNLVQPDLNAAGTDFARIGPAHFEDGVLTPIEGANPREISNIVVAGNGDLANPEGLSGMMYAWGQFIDHDLDLSMSDGVSHIDITIPEGDPTFTAGATIPLTRAVIDPATGTPGSPATAVNSITGWLDASNIYGSDAQTAASLRLPDGHMKTSEGNNLPIVDGVFMAGDVRATENPDLTALQTLFVREHNYQVDRLHEAHPTWIGDQLYENAKTIVTAEIANITYNEFLPHLLGPDAIAPYDGYDPDVDPRITEEFAGAVFRFGHSIVSADIEQTGEQGQVLGAQELKDAFFETPQQFNDAGSADGLLRHLTGDLSNALDTHLVDDLRDFLVDPPDGMDLAAINIERGRDLGLGTLNETRIALGLDPYTNFDQITSDPQTAANLAAAFGSVDKVDLWTGGLAENHVNGAMVGETFDAIIGNQFEALRDGDRYYFENQNFDPKTLKMIEGTSLADIIVRNTDVDHMQSDAFVFYDRHSGTTAGITGEEPDAPQLVIGSTGKDTLLGGPQGDILVAAAGGLQTMSGFGGADQFVLTPGANGVITDFTPGIDSLEFEGGNGKHFHMLVHHGNTIIQMDHDHVVLLGVLPSELHGEVG